MTVHTLVSRLASINYFVLVLPLVLSACDFISQADSHTTVEPEALVREASTGRVRGVDHGDYLSWLGIPYAEPPLAALRWKAPRPLLSSELRDAHQFGSRCSQAKPKVEQHVLRAMEYWGSEDCLFLNVWAPAKRQPLGGDVKQGLPVMVWIHGGGDILGSGNLEAGTLVSTQDVVVVSMNYRLGPFGWLSHPALHSHNSSANDRSGNFGTLDIIESLHWVQKNIAEFGGDPNRVTLFGTSAGGWNIFSLLGAPAAKGLFHGAIVQSGVPRMASRDYAENFVDDPIPGHAQSSNELLLQLIQDDGLAGDRGAAKAYLQAMTAAEVSSLLHSKNYPQLELALDQLARQNRQRFLHRERVNETKLNGFIRIRDDSVALLNHGAPKIFRDGSVLSSQDFQQTVGDGQANGVPVILSTTRGESKGFQSGDTEYIDIQGEIKVVKDPERYRLVDEYVSKLWKASGADEPAAALSRMGQAVYVARFDWDDLPTNINGQNNQLMMGAHHSADYAFLFGAKKPYYADEDFNAEAKQLSASMMSYFAEFAYQGKPGKGRQGRLPEWRPWSNEGSDKTLLLDAASDGGIRMSEDHGNREQVLAQILADPRVNTLRARCRLYRDILQQAHTFLTVAEFNALEGGLCVVNPAKGGSAQ